MCGFVVAFSSPSACLPVRSIACLNITQQFGSRCAVLFFDMADQDQNEIENFILPSVQLPLRQTYTYASPIPKALLDSREPCKLGVDEAGRGPCLGRKEKGPIFLPVLVIAKEIFINLSQVLWCMAFVTIQNLGTKNLNNLDSMVYMYTIFLCLLLRLL